MQETKEHIRTRMMKNLARAWGYPDTEGENNFDPLVSLLLGAFATELEKVSGEIHLSRARVLERLVQLLSPDVLTGALPAHAVARALPVEHATDVCEDAQFYTRLKLPAAGETEESVVKDVFFSPTATFHVNRASVRFMATGNQLFKINNTTSKETIAHTSSSNQLPPSTLWLGIDEPGICLHNTSFFFDLRNEVGKQLFYHQLPKAAWFDGTTLLEHLPGYGNREICGETVEIESLLHRDHHVGHKIKSDVHSFYKPYFITLNDRQSITAKKDVDPTPEIIAHAFTGKALEQLGQTSLRWISVRFPQAISNHLLQDVVCTMNCFPVVNRKLHQINYRLQEFINIIPLKTDDAFLDLEEVTNDENKPLPVQATANDNEEIMLIRNGGTGRFDERDATLAIDHLLHLLRDESAAFSIMDKEFVSGEVRQLQQVINRLSQKLFSRPVHTGSAPYLVINKNEHGKGKSLFIKYWSTNGARANHIKAGTGLQLYKGGAIQRNTVVFITTTNGGRDTLNATEKVLAYKSALLSKDRLITTADIKAFCHYQLGDKVKEIQIQKGVMTLPGGQQGFKRTIDVVVALHEHAYAGVKEKNELDRFWEENLHRLLEERSVVGVQYRVIVK